MIHKEITYYPPLSEFVSGGALGNVLGHGIVRKRGRSSCSNVAAAGAAAAVVGSAGGQTGPPQGLTWPHQHVIGRGWWVSLEIPNGLWPRVQVPAWVPRKVPPTLLTAGAYLLLVVELGTPR